MPLKQQMVKIDVERWVVDRPTWVIVMVDGKRVWLSKKQFELDEDKSIIRVPRALAWSKGLTK